MDRFSPTERIGVNQVEKIFLSEFKWIPRTISQSDIGIDMEVEICLDDKYTGQLIGVQIKSGESYFNTTSFGDIVYRGSITHLEYWLNHSLPIVIVLHNPTTGKTIWQKIDESTITRTKKGWKTEIPFRQELTAAWKDELEKLNKYPLYFQRLQRLAVHKDWMHDIVNGEKIVVEVKEWVNKSIGRATIQVKMIGFFAGETVLSEGEYIHFHDINDLTVLFPWAEFATDEEYYDENVQDDFIDEYGIYDPEEKRYVGTSISFEEFKADLPAIRAIQDASGEIQTYRLELSLNSLGKSFLDVNNFLDFGLQLKLSL